MVRGERGKIGRLWQTFIRKTLPTNGTTEAGASDRGVRPGKRPKQIWDVPGRLAQDRHRE